ALQDDYFVQAEDGVRAFHVTGVQTCALPILPAHRIMPVRTGAVPPPEPDAQPKPGKGGKQQGDQVPFTGAGKYPSRDIEQDESRSEERRVGKGRRSRRWSDPR